MFVATCSREATWFVPTSSSFSSSFLSVTTKTCLISYFHFTLSFLKSLFKLLNYILSLSLFFYIFFFFSFSMWFRRGTARRVRVMRLAFSVMLVSGVATIQAMMFSSMPLRLAVAVIVEISRPGQTQGAVISIDKKLKIASKMYSQPIL